MDSITEKSSNLIIKEISKHIKYISSLIMGHKRVIATHLTALLDTNACEEEKLAIIDVNENKKKY